MTSVFEVTAGKAIGYVTGLSVEQQSNKTTAVTINAVAGKITTANGAIASGATVIFTVNNDTVADNDVVIVSFADGNNSASGGTYFANITELTAGRFDIAVTNFAQSSGNDQLDINFIVVKSEATS